MPILPFGEKKNHFPILEWRQIALRRESILTIPQCKITWFRESHCHHADTHISGKIVREQLAVYAWTCRNMRASWTILSSSSTQPCTMKS
jgi:hypothetical protein